MKKIIYKVNTDDLMQMSKEIGVSSGSQKKQKKFLDHISKSKLFREIKKGNMKKYTFFFKDKYQKALSNLKEEVKKEYDTWNEQYLREQNQKNIEQLEKQKIPLKCSNLAPPVIPKLYKYERLSTTCFKVLDSISNYCDKFDSTNPKNMVENIICDVYIKRLGNFCKRAYAMLYKMDITDFTEADKIQKKFMEDDKIRKKIVTKLCYGDDLNIEVGLVQFSTRLQMLMRLLVKAQKIKDPKEQSFLISNALQEIITQYPESKKYTGDFVEGRFVEFRRSAEVFLKYVDDKLQPALTALAAILKPLAKEDKYYTAEVKEKERLKKIKRQNKESVN